MRTATDAVFKTVALFGFTLATLGSTTTNAHAVARAARVARPTAAVGVSSPPASAPVSFHVDTNERSLRWSYTLENSSRAPVEVVADRRLIWLEVTASPNAVP